MKSFFKIRTLLTVLGVVLLALFIWYAGPYFAFGQYRPLESPTVRIVVIAMIGVWIGVSVLLKRMRANRASDKLMAAVVTQAQTTDARPSAEAVQLRERFEDAVATLKQKRRSGHTLYELPWYVIIGAPGSGKTTALLNSGLKFPVEQRTGKGALRGVGGTRNCDWWFTDEAVLLDTAGRYTTQDSDATADSAAWTEFLSLLRKYRGRRPVNGVILAISAQDLMIMGSAAREAHVAAVRRRLDELNGELRMQLPVYLMVTKCDLVAGFTEYFDDQAQEGRAQVWGVTFSYDQTLNGDSAKTFPSEFDALIGRLNERLFPRLDEDRDGRRRAKVFGFPLQMAALRGPLTQFISETFVSTRFDRQLLLRGVYFTSGTQEGTPIDRLLGALGREFAVAPDVVTPGRGKAYFIERLLKDVMFAESGLAGVNRRMEVQKAALQLSAYAAMLLIAVIGVVVFSASYSRNRSYLDEVGADVAALSEVPPASDGSSLERQLPRLDAIRAVDESANRYASDIPIAMRWGLYQGSSLGNAARDAYARELNDALLPRVAARFRQRVMESAAEPEKLYEYLKAYLMLGDPERLDPEQLGYLAEQEWDAAYASAPDTRASASRHFRSLLEYSGKVRKMALDEEIVAQARNTLRQASKPGLVYRYLRIAYANDTARAVRLDLAAGLGADRVLRRKSGVSLATPVPALYTRDVFREVAERGTDDLVKQFSAEEWVWGPEGSAVSGSTNLTAEVLDVYERDYIAYWDRIVKEIEPVPMGSLRNTKEALAILAGPSSPLRGLLRAVDQHTFLVAPEDPAKPTTGIQQRLEGVFDKTRQVMGLSKVAAGAQVTAHFADIHRLVTGDAGAAPIDGILRTLDQIQQKLGPLGEEVGAKPPDPGSVREVGELANALKRDAAPLPPAVGAVVTEIANSSLAAVRSAGGKTVRDSYEQAVLQPCRDIINGRYPFEVGSQSDVPLADFERLFGPNGVFDAYFRNELQALVNTTRAPWTWRTDASGAPVGGGLPLSQFEAAQRIRDMFFRPGVQKAEARFVVTPTFLDVSAGRFTLEIDGQTIDYRYGPERPWPVTWPGPKPGLAAAAFERPGGQPNLTFQGAWAWFRLLENTQVERESDERYLVTIKRGTREARVRVEADSVRNPFGNSELQRFRCG
jgi:type VI secretion system protein ImpL